MAGKPKITLSAYKADAYLDLKQKLASKEKELLLKTNECQISSSRIQELMDENARWGTRAVDWDIEIHKKEKELAEKDKQLKEAQARFEGLKKEAYHREAELLTQGFDINQHFQHLLEERDKENLALTNKVKEGRKGIVLLNKELRNAWKRR